MSTYIVGETIKQSVSFTAVVGGAPVDPDTVTLVVTCEGHVRNFALGSGVVRDSAGHYSATNTLLYQGFHKCRWEGTTAGDVHAIAENQFSVLASAL